MIFPEGGRSEDGQLQDFMSGAFYLAIKAQADIVPMALAGTYEMLPMNTWHVKPRPIYLLIGDIREERQTNNPIRQFLCYRQIFMWIVRQDRVSMASNGPPFSGSNPLAQKAADHNICTPRWQNHVARIGYARSVEVGRWQHPGNVRERIEKPASGTSKASAHQRPHFERDESNSR